MRVARALLIVNEASGTGLDASPEALCARLAARAGLDVSLAVVRTHPEAREAAARWLAAETGCVALVVGGGGGTLRAVVEGACPDRAPLPDAARARFVPLRFGSGNLVSKRLGYAKAPLDAIDQAAPSLASGLVTPGAVLRAELGTAGGATRHAIATSLVGLGLFGRTANDVLRGPRRFRRTRAALAAVVGLERLNHAEALACVALRAVQGACFPSACERVRVRHRDLDVELRLLSGAVLAFDVPLIPFVPRARFGEAALSAHLVPVPSGPARLRILADAPRLAREAPALRLEPGAPLSIELLDRERAELFLDEDPESFVRALSLECAGTIAYVPASEAR